MSTLKFVIAGIPQGKGAARHSSKGFTYTPTKTRNYMALVAMCASAAGAQPKDCPCEIFINAYFPIPASHSKKLQQEIREGKVLYTKKPDTDNLGKIKDALNTIAFSDDSNVWKEHITKYYSDNPRMEVEIVYYDSPPYALGFSP